jgi:hypothetical protein
VKAVRENIVCLKALLPRIMELIKEGECAHMPPAEYGIKTEGNSGATTVTGAK